MMSCPNCGKENMFDWTLLCPECFSDTSAMTDYDYDDDEETVTCRKCGTKRKVSDPATLIEGDKSCMLWQCPCCGRVYDLGA